jgi:hypothetical protein
MLYPDLSELLTLPSCESRSNFFNERMEAHCLKPREVEKNAKVRAREGSSGSGLRGVFALCPISCLFA